MDIKVFEYVKDIDIYMIVEESLFQFTVWYMIIS